jgi:hypothetical protein
MRIIILSILAIANDDLSMEMDIDKDSVGIM